MKRFFKLLLCAVLIAAITGALNFAIIPVNYNHIFLHQWREQYTGIDTVVIGDSLTLRSVQPSVMDEKMDTAAFNTATAQQDLLCTYYYLKDILASCGNLKRVYLGLDYWNFIEKENDEGVNIQAALIILDRLQTLRGKADFAVHTIKLDAAWNGLFRFRNSIGSVYSIPGTIRSKLSPAYRQYDKVDEHDYNTDKGYAYSDKVGTNLDINSHDLRKLSKNSLQYYEDILALCRDAGVEVCVFQTPYTKERLSMFIGYDHYQDSVRQIAEKYDAPFYDFNMHPQRDTLDDSVCFKDAAHLNYTGSCLFMQWFCEVYAA